jgi:hypothetical protein
MNPLRIKMYPVLFSEAEKLSDFLEETMTGYFEKPKEDRLEGLNTPAGWSRSEFLRRIVPRALAIGAVATLTGTTLGCVSVRELTENAVAGAGDGADKWADKHPEEKAKVKQAVDDLAVAIREFRITTEQSRQITERVNAQYERNEENIDRVLEAAGIAASFFIRLRDIFVSIMDLFERFKDSIEDLTSILVYFIRQLVAKLGQAIAEMLLFLLYFLFIARIRRLMEELRRKFWLIPWLRLLF